MFKQPRIPEYRESEGTGKYLRSLVLFLKDFCMDCWVSVRELQKGGGGLLRALTSDPRESGEEAPELSAVPVNADQLGGMTYKQIVDMIYPIGRTITTLSDDDNPNTLYPWQVWEQTAKGRMIIGTGANEANTDETYGSLAAGTVNRTLGEMGGCASVALTEAQNARHRHTPANTAYYFSVNQPTSSDAVGRVQVDTSSSSGIYAMAGNSNAADVVGTYGITESQYTAYAGSGQAHSNMSPYIAANIWKRVS